MKWLKTTVEVLYLSAFGGNSIDYWPLTYAVVMLIYAVTALIVWLTGGTF